MTEALAALTQINLNDLVDAFGWQHQPVLAELVRRLFHRAARDFARQMLFFDAAIGSRGLTEAACLTERFYVRDVQLFGADCIPDGPTLFLANHPGMTDTLALFAALARPDLRIIALNRPFLLSLPNLSRQLLYLTDDPRERTALVRHVVRHLRSGGSVLTFPAGHTEPDPANYPGALESLQDWTDSATAFLRLAPETTVVPVCVRGVTWDKTTRTPLVRLRRAVDDRMLLASALQLLSNIVLGTRPVTVAVEVGAPIRARDLSSEDSSELHRAVIGSMRTLLSSRQRGQGISVL